MPDPRDRKRKATPAKKATAPPAPDPKAQTAMIEAIAQETARRIAVARGNRTIVRIFERPTRSDVRWSEIESLVRRLGGTIKNGKGSRRRIVLPGIAPGDKVIGLLHEPHPQPECTEGAVEDFRDTLANAGYKP